MNNQIIHLPNKLRIALDEIKEVETVSIAVFVNSGSRNEVKENNGISHFLEHMAFKGTVTRSAKEIAEQFENIGGRINAFTSREKTVYYAKVLKDDINFAIEFLSDILQNSVFDREEMEKERGVILQEIAMTNDTPDDIIYDYFQESAFPNQAIGRSILGPEENIKKFKDQDLINYISAQYNYLDMAVVAAGNISSVDFEREVARHFNKLGEGSLQQPEAASYKGGDVRKEKDLEQINLLLGFKGISYLNQNYYKSQILASILGGGMASRLFQEVREKRGLAYSVHAFNYANFDSGIFGVYAATNDDKVNQLIEVVRDQLLTLIENITQEELNRAVSQVRAGLLMASESTSSRAQKLGSDILAYNRIISNQEILEQIYAITTKDLKELAEQLISSSCPTFAAIGKIKPILPYDKIINSFK